VKTGSKATSLDCLHLNIFASVRSGRGEQELFLCREQAWSCLFAVYMRPMSRCIVEVGRARDAM
jgi:hypothetical protein